MNAKELALAKLNASDKTLGMYIYGLSIGMDFDHVSSLIMSPVGKTLTSVMEGNVFNNDNGLFSLDKVFDYFELGPKKLVQEDRRSFNILGHSLISGNEFMSPELKLAKYAWTYSQFPTNIQGDMSSKFIKAYRQYKTYFRQILLIKNNMNTYNSLKELYFGAEEMRHLGAILGLNQGIATRIPDIINKVSDFEKVLQSRADIINNESKRRQTRAWYKDPNVNRTEYSKISPRQISINSFINNPELFIESYERIKHSFNILDVVNTLPHFKGYLKMLNLLDLSAKNSGNRYATTRELLNYVSDKNTPKKELDRLIRKIDWFYGDYLRNQWMIDEDITFSLPNKNRVYNNNFLNKGYTDKGGLIILGTRWGNASFKYYIENVLIPEMLNDVRFKNNLFIKNLLPDITTLTVDNVPRVYLVLGINMLPSSEAERAIFNEYKAAFNSIASNEVRIGNKSITVRDAFYLYGLIAHYGKQGRSSIMPIFENQHNSGLLKEFHDYQSKFKGIKISSETLSFLNEYIIPYKSPYQAIEETIYWKNSNGDVVKWNKVHDEYDVGIDDNVINGYRPQRIKYEDSLVRNYDMASTESSAKTITINNTSLLIVDGKFKHGKLDGIDVPYQTDPVTKQQFINEKEVKILLKKLNC